MQIQEYVIEIVHIKGTDNFLCNLISGNPTGITNEKVCQMSRPRDILVTKIDLNLDPHVKKDLKKLAAHQSKDPRIVEIKQKLALDKTQSTTRYKVDNGIL
jgi:hypothetical protein